ncbi:hypothetical protein [Vibrio sonorensis]|uniref:hypothetical protein n=1 Tax=Vibrio sonorensis TaxID=1004316 RepID=UPI000A001698|nr:hypothetical protein [Vibrio sonorensis]
MTNHNHHFSEREIKTTALVYDRKLANNRASFSMEMSFKSGENGTLKGTRKWYCIGDEAVSIEKLEWCANKGIHRVSMHNLSLRETAEMRHSDKSGDFELCSPKTNMLPKVKSTQFNTSPATLLSLPFEVAKHWNTLKKGEKLIFDYSVLKVQAHTKVSLQAKIEDGYFVVELKPLSWFWQLVFGSTYMYFDQDKPVLRKIDGLIEPRDKKPNGRYLEYLAMMEFDSGVDLSRLVKV